jgi:hypothetical protein
VDLHKTFYTAFCYFLLSFIEGALERATQKKASNKGAMRGPSQWSLERASSGAVTKETSSG